MITRTEWINMTESIENEIDLSELSEIIHKLIDLIDFAEICENNLRRYIKYLMEAKHVVQSSIISVKSLIYEEIINKYPEEANNLDKRTGTWLKSLDELEESIYSNVDTYTQNVNYAKLKKLEMEIKTALMDFIYKPLLRAQEEYSTFIHQYPDSNYNIKHFIFEQLLNSINVLGIETRYETYKIKPIIQRPIDYKKKIITTEEPPTEIQDEEVASIFAEPNESEEIQI